MKKKNLTGLSLNKKSIVNFATVVGGNQIVTAPTNYEGCVNDTNNACVYSGLCAPAPITYLCNTNLQTKDQCDPRSITTNVLNC